MGAKSGWKEDALFDIASICFDDRVSVPTTPIAGQVELYIRNGELCFLDSSAVETCVSLPTVDADQVNFDSAITDNTAVGDTVQDFIDNVCAPTNSQKPTYLGNGELGTLEIFSNATQITANRILSSDIVYDASLNPITETWKHYDTADGTTVLKTVTFTHTWVSDEWTKTTTVTS